MLTRRLILAAAIAACGLAAGCGPTKADLAARQGVREYLAATSIRPVRTFEPLADKTDENSF